MTETKNDNLKMAMCHMKIIALMDKQIKDTEDMMEVIIHDEGIICIHLHHEMLYHNNYPKEDQNAFDDFVDPQSQFQTPMGTNIIVDARSLPPEVRDKMLNPDEIRQVMSFSGINPNDHPRAKKSKTYKVNVKIVSAICSAMLHGFKEQRQRSIDILISLGLNINQILKPNEKNE